MKQRWNDTDRGIRKGFEKDLSQCHFGLTNPTWTDLGTKPGLGVNKPATNRLSYGTVIEVVT
jgi:hypothetical protein